MKVSTSIFVVGFLAIGIVFVTPLENEPPKLEGFIDKLINDTINKLLANLTDPIAFDSLPLNSSSKVLNGTFNLSTFRLYGIKDLVATKINVSIFTMAMNASIKIPQIILNSKYACDLAVIELIPFYGDGQVTVTIDDVEINVNGKVSTKGGLNISNVTLSFTLEDAVFQLTGLLNNEDLSSLITTVLNDNVVDFINNNQKAISSTVSPLAEKIINALLGNGSKSIEFSEFEELYEAEIGKLKF